MGQRKPYLRCCRRASAQDAGHGGWKGRPGALPLDPARGSSPGLALFEGKSGGARSSGVPPAPPGSPDAATRLFRMAKPIAGTLAASYLMARGIVSTPDMRAMRFHPHCWYRAAPGSSDEACDAWPAVIAAVTDLDGTITGVQRTWLDTAGQWKAPIATPRRALGHLLGNAVRFGRACDVITLSIASQWSDFGLFTSMGARRALSMMGQDTFTTK